MIPISLQEALARLSTNDPIEVHIERVPNNGTTHIQTFSRAYCMERLQNNQPYETGKVGQSKDIGINIVTVASPTGKAEDLGLCMVFFQTRPECRLTNEQLEQSKARGRGANIFSCNTETQTHNE